MTETFYDVLGVAPDASADEIERAYRESLKESHPDLNDAEDASERTQRVIRARDVLTDEGERERYDRIGHEAYVGETTSGVDESDVSQAARAARQAGWAEESDDSEPPGGNAASRANARRRARQRRRREQAAHERVGNDRTDASDQNTARNSTNRRNGARSGADGTQNATGNPSTAQAGNRTTTDGGASFGHANGYGDVRGSKPSWTSGSGYSVRKGTDSGLQRSRLFPLRQSLTLLTVAFALYPVMLFSTVFPPFPLVVNVVVGLCTILLVAYLQSIPEVGVVVFGLWSLITPVVLLTFGVSLTSIVGVLALTGTWLPLGLSATTVVLLRT